MDPVTGVLAILTLANVAQQVLLIARKIRRFEGAKVDEIYYRLVVEQAKNKGWVNDLRNRNGEDFLASINPAELEEVTLLMDRLNKYHKEAQVKYRAIEAAGDRGNQQSGVKRAKARFLYGGFEDLKMMADTLAAMNEALRSIVPLLPAYDGGPATSYQLAQPFHETQTLANPSLRGDGIQPRPAAVAPAEDSPPAAVVPQHTLPLIQAMWRLALAALTNIAWAKMEKLLENSAGRLKLWGIGLFEDGTALDKILVSRSLQDSPFCRILLRTLAEILLLEGETTLEHVCCTSC
jgi:hypothetical protein